MALAPSNPPTTRSGRRTTLAMVVGVAVAAALGTFIPREESGRTVEATVDPVTTELEVRHIAGRQYLRVYLDMVGVATACDGITTLNGRPMPRNHTFTEAQCTVMLEDELVKHAQGVMACTPGLALTTGAAEVRREGPRFAAVSLAYNVGVGGYCGSTARARFNSGNFASGCTALTWWNKAGGRVVRGLALRRGREYRVCTEGLSALGSV